MLNMRIHGIRKLRFKDVDIFIYKYFEDINHAFHNHLFYKFDEKYRYRDFNTTNKNTNPNRYCGNRYGFALSGKLPKDRIYIWFNEKADDKDIIELIAHEYGHIMIDRLESQEIKEESIAVMIGKCASFAYGVLDKL